MDISKIEPIELNKAQSVAVNTELLDAEQPTEYAEPTFSKAKSHYPAESKDEPIAKKEDYFSADQS